MRDELDRAARLCRSASKQVQQMFDDARLGRTLDAAGCSALVHDISASMTRNPGALLTLARLKTQDDYSYMHSVAVCALMIALGRQLGMDDGQCREAGVAGLMHDIGKAFIPPAILAKPGKLDDAEFAVIKTHPERGHHALVAGDTMAPSTLDVCLHHHERMDGKGYPHGLAGDQISLLARMGAVCDVYDAVTSDRPYKAGWDPADAIARMSQWEGHFDPAMIRALVLSLGVYPNGSLVRLESQRIAVVIEQNAQAMAKPVVKAFFSQKSRLPIPPETVDLAAPHCTDRVQGREDVEGWNQRDIALLWAGDAVPKGFKSARAAPLKRSVRS
jgi:HD-GYP domain-containing protein (c-di-GMP phosphodiesterase class II)